MGEAYIRAIIRSEKPKKVRRDGFAPGIIYGEGIDVPIPVKFEMVRLKRLLKRHLSNAKIDIKLGDSIRKCVVKEVQRHPVTSDILHIDLQTVNENENVKLKIPVTFTGKKMLDSRKHVLHIYISEIEVSGCLKLLPDRITVDVGEMSPGEKFTVGDIKIDSDIKILNGKDEILAVVTAAKELEAAS